jgi:hypothetical protein
VGFGLGTKQIDGAPQHPYLAVESGPPVFCLVEMMIARMGRNKGASPKSLLIEKINGSARVGRLIDQPGMEALA